MKHDISGQLQIQAALLQAIAELKPSGALGRAVRFATVAAHRYAVAITPVDTGAQRAAQTPEVNLRRLSGRVFYDPDAVNPRSDARPARYGPENEVERGGRYAVYEKTYREAGADIVAQAGKIIKKALP